MLDYEKTLVIIDDQITDLLPWIVQAEYETGEIKTAYRPTLKEAQNALNRFVRLAVKYDEPLTDIIITKKTK